MALSKRRLSSAIVSALDSSGVYDTALDKTAAVAASSEIIEIIVTAIIDEFTANATVTVLSGIAVATTGTAAAQTGSTTATGSGSIS